MPEEYVVSEFTSNLIVSRCRSCGDSHPSLFLLRGGGVSIERRNQVVATALPCLCITCVRKTGQLYWISCLCSFESVQHLSAPAGAAAGFTEASFTVMHHRGSSISRARLKRNGFKETAGRCRDAASEGDRRDLATSFHSSSVGSA